MLSRPNLLAKYRDLSTQFSSLSLGKAASLQQEKDAQAQRPIFTQHQQQNTREPLAAPLPQRAPAPGVWTPDMPIAFGSPAPGGAAGTGAGVGAPAISTQKQGDGRWDPGSGVRFG